VGVTEPAGHVKGSVCVLQLLLLLLLLLPTTAAAAVSGGDTSGDNIIGRSRGRNATQSSSTPAAAAAVMFVEVDLGSTCTAHTCVRFVTHLCEATHTHTHMCQVRYSFV
jgi:hypothetical protein